MALKMGDGDAAAKDISKLIEILRRQKGEAAIPLLF